MVVLDRRIVDRKYGRRFLNSLPTKTHFKGDTPTVLKKINNWALGERPVKRDLNILELGTDIAHYLESLKKRDNNKQSL